MKKATLHAICLLCCGLIGALQLNAQTVYTYTINTIAGNGTNGYSGDGGSATSAELGVPCGVLVDGSGNIYVGDKGNACIRKINLSGSISTIAGTDVAGYSGDGGQATSAKLNNPYGMALDASGNLYIADANNNCVRKITSAGVISTLAGTGTAGYSGDGGQAASAQLNKPHDVAVDAAGNVYIADMNNNCIRMVTTSGIIATVAGNGTGGFSGDGGLATAAELKGPAGIAFDASGNLYIADSYNERIRKVDASTGKISTIAGTGTYGFSGDGGSATNAGFSSPSGVAVDTAGNVYVADDYDYRIRKIAPNGTITTIAGAGTPSFSGDGGPAQNATLNQPFGVSVGPQGNVYIADSYNNRIRKVTITTGIHELSIEGQINIYPNPSQGTLYYTASKIKIDGKTTMYIYNAMGQLVYSSPVKQGTNQVDLSGQANGIYILQIQSDKGSFTEKLVLNK